MRYIAKTLYGFEQILANELLAIGVKKVKPINRAVIFWGNKETLYQVNYASRIALSVLEPISEFSITSKQDLYDRCMEIDWSEYMDVDDSFSVVPVVNSKIFPHTGYPALVVKDAIVDYFRDKFGRRPSVNLTDPDLVINLHISKSKVDMSIDSTVIPLYKRGYRREHGDASLNECMAAGMLKLSGWNPEQPLVDPMCGSGTILIEGALMASNIPGGMFRNGFGFQKWKSYDERLFNRVKAKEEEKITVVKSHITGSDISEEAVRNAMSNIDGAHLNGIVKVKTSDIKTFSPSYEGGFLVTNPPYGQRIVPEDIMDLYGTIGSSLKHNFAGYHAWILTSEKSLLNKIGLKPYSKYNLYNGSIPCYFVGYELYKGSLKTRGNVKNVDE